MPMPAGGPTKVEAPHVTVPTTQTPGPTPTTGQVPEVATEPTPGAEIVELYGKRFTIEETFRDQKNLRFGMGLSDTRIGDPDRRDRMLLISAIAISLLTILDAAGEAIGHDKWLKANTVRRRTISLVRQGLMHCAALPKMKPEMLEPLMAKFGEMLRAQPVFRESFGLI